MLSPAASSRVEVLAVIPARYGATRLPGKPLADICGKSMIQWVWEATTRAKGVDRVIVATDDARIFETVKAFGGEVKMTDPALPSGTDRVAAVAREIPAPIVVNVQGDEPLVESAVIEAAVRCVRDRGFPMGSAMTSLRDRAELENPAVVKVLTDIEGRALYFSRLTIPFSRGGVPENLAEWPCRRHLGVYAYRIDALMRLSALPPSGIEKGEVLEQLRAMENGIAIGLEPVQSRTFGIDTPEDLDRVRRILSQN